MKAGDLMMTGAATVHPWDTIGEAARTMVNYGVSGLPVVDAEPVSLAWSPNVTSAQWYKDADRRFGSSFQQLIAPYHR